ncbi:peroxidase family protein [Reyranella soli]|uniref:Myeloperoxidase n=1 Tax=Reyranella soli TaxID=1230389 RepID=A0A512NRP1_9HYPH|nr:heme peroxidase family protein [Reyranella soli]GEP61582.1 myeloperoxidase [Reyranella soli]
MAAAVNVSPGHGLAGRKPSREFLDTLSGHDDPGMFGRMLPTLTPLVVGDAALQELADAMKDTNPADPAGDSKIPAGFTYLGQFVDHDITLDLTSIGEKQADPLATENFRTPSLDLDSIYGLGPDGSRQLYARDSATGSGKTPGPKFLIGKTVNVDLGGVTGDHRNDLPRSPEGFALIGDHRNDENLLVAQTHLAMLKFHNKVCDRIAGGGKSAGQIFSEARQIVTWHYQWMVLHDFVERLTEPGIVARILHEGRRFYRFRKVPYMPVEFSGAIYRLGHSMVRQAYSHNRIFTGGGVTIATLDLLFQFTGLSGNIIGDLAPNPAPGPLPLPVLSSNWIIDWRRFYDFAPAANPADVPLGVTRKIDPFIVPQLHELPGDGGSLPFRNLRRGVMLGLPSGQDIASAMRIRKPLTPDEIAQGPDGAVAEKHGLHLQTPLWYYILKEAQVRGGGERLGPVGATLLAEVFIGLVHGDHQSYLWQRGPSWKPDLPSQKAGTFTMADLLRFVGDISPIDGITTF